MIIWIFCSDTVLCISPGSTVIFPKSETAMLSTGNLSSVVQVVPFNILSCRDVHSDQLKQKAHDFDKKFEKKVNLKRLKLKIPL